MRWGNQSSRNNKINKQRRGQRGKCRRLWARCVSSTCSSWLFESSWLLIEATNHGAVSRDRVMPQTCQLPNNKWRTSVSHVVNMMNACKKRHLLRSSNAVDTLTRGGQYEGGCSRRRRGGRTQLYVRVANNHVRRTQRPLAKGSYE